MAKQETRKKILKAAEELFSKNGYDGVPTKMIANKAGITEMTLFNHFHNKELLYKTVIKERYLAMEIQSVFSELTYDDLEKDLKIVSKKLLNNFFDNKKILLMRMKEKQSLHEHGFRIEQDPIFKQMILLFKAYEKKHSINGSSENAALLFIITFKGICRICLLDDKNKKEMNTIINDYVTTFCHGIICNDERVIE